MYRVFHVNTVPIKMYMISVNMRILSYRVPPILQLFSIVTGSTGQPVSVYDCAAKNCGCCVQYNHV